MISSRLGSLLVALVGGSVALGLSACGDNANTGGGDPSVALRSAALTPLADCDDLEATVRAAALRAVYAQIDVAMNAALAGPLPQDCNRYYDDYAASAGGTPTNDEGGTSTPSDSGSSGATDVSTTNNQIVGVDEADLVKNDSQFLYVASKNQLRIIQAWPAESAHPVGAATVPGVATQLFVEGDTAVVFSSEGGYPGSSCTYGYECVPGSDGSTTTMSVFDLADRSAPKLVRTVHHSGSLLAARRIGTMVHAVVATAPVPFLSSLSFDTCGKNFAQLQAAYHATRQQAAMAIAAQDLSAYLPAISDSAAPEATDTLCRGLYASALTDGQAFTSLVSFDLATTAPASMTTVLSSPGVVMGAPDAMYLAVPHQRNLGGGAGWFEGMDDVQDASDIHKFAVGATPQDTRYEASGVVKGRVLNQFALDEHDGYIRVATTSSHAPDPNAHSTMSILAARGSALSVVGSVDHIAPSEDIRSVRFDGDRAFVVTFKKTDPLYAFDLSKPAQPRITGELKIPGFSTYMHLMDETHLLTIGYDADDHGDFAYFDGVLFQIFDISNPAQPVQTFTHLVGTRGSSSEALTNHLAFNYFAPKNLLAVPMTICEGGDDGTFGDTMSFSGLMVFDVTASSGFAEHGRVSHPPSQGASCGQWWSNATSEVKRSVIMDDYVFSLSDSRIKVNKLDNLSADLVDLPLGN
jgi:hypothetical protein